MQNLSHYIINDILSCDQIEPLDILNLATTCKQFSNLAKEEICKGKYVLPSPIYEPFYLDKNRLICNYNDNAIASFNIKTGDIKYIGIPRYFDDVQKILYKTSVYDDVKHVYDYNFNLICNDVKMDQFFDVTSKKAYHGKQEYDLGVYNGHILYIEKDYVLQNLNTGEIIQIGGDFDFINCVSLNLKYAATRKGLYDISRGKIIYDIKQSNPLFTNDSRYYITHFRKTLYFFDIVNEKEYILETKEEIYYISANEDNILLCTMKNSIMLLDVETRKILKEQQLQKQ